MSNIKAKYTCNVSGVVPSFNNGYVYEIDEVYNGDGTYTVTITSDEDFSNVSFENNSNLLAVEYLKVTNKVTSTAGMFYNCDSVISLNLSDFDTSNVTEMWEMFCYCCSLETIIGIENWNTGKVNDLTYTFMCCCCGLESLNLSGWDTSNVVLLDETFSDCTYLEELNISNWDLSKADQDWLQNIFYISELDPENDYWYDPDWEPYLKIIKCNNANTISLIAPYLPDRRACEEAGVIITDNPTEINMEVIVNKNWIITDKDPRIVAMYTCNTSGVVPNFNSGYEYKINEIDNGDGTYTVTITSDEDFTSCSFNGKTSLLTVEYLKITNKITSMNGMFGSCTSVTDINTSEWDTVNVTTIRDLFYNCKSLISIDVGEFNTSKVTDMWGVFSGCMSLAIIDGINNWDTTKVNNMGSMFGACQRLTKLDVSNFNTSKVTRMDTMFSACVALTTIDVSNFDTRNVNYMSYMFSNCYALRTLDVSNFDTSNVITTAYMFNGCQKLTKLDVSNFNTSKVTNMSYLFNNCSSLEDINVSRWDTSSVNNMTNMFNCKELKHVNMKNTDYNAINNFMTLLPTMTENDPGSIDISGVNDFDQVNIELARSKKWKIYAITTSEVKTTLNKGHNINIKHGSNNMCIITVDRRQI